MPKSAANAARKSHARVDLTQGPISRTLLLFSLPILGSSVLQSLNGSINALWVGRLLGAEALTATTNANLILLFLLVILFGVGMAGSILVGQAVGANDLPLAKKVVGTMATFFLVTSLATAIGGVSATGPLLRWMGAPEDVRPMAEEYLRVVAMLYLLDQSIVNLFLPGRPDAVALAKHINNIAGWSFVLFGMTLVLFGAVRATGAVTAPLVILVISLFGVRIGFAHMLEPVWGQDAIWWSFPASMAVSALLALAYYLWGGWRNAQIGPPTRDAGDVAPTAPPTRQLRV